MPSKKWYLLKKSMPGEKTRYKEGSAVIIYDNNETDQKVLTMLKQHLGEENIEDVSSSYTGSDRLRQNTRVNPFATEEIKVT